jgi:O-antigen ligase
MSYAAEIRSLPRTVRIASLFWMIVTIPLAVWLGPIWLFLLFAAVFAAWLIQRTVWAIAAIILLHYFLFQESETITLPEFAFAFFFNAFLLFWLFERWRHQQPVLKSRVQILLILFLASAIISIVPAILFRVSILKWLRELVPVWNLLLILPISHSIRDRRERQLLMLAFFLLAAAIGIRNLVQYIHATQSVRMLWQFISARQSANEPVLLAVFLFAASYFIFGTRKGVRLLSLVIAAIFGTGLILTFSRGYWFAALFGLLILFITLPLKRKLFALGFLMTFLLIFLLAFRIFFGAKFEKFYDAVSSRLLSIENVKMDISIRNRVEETRAVWKEIRKNPVIGYGLGKTYVFIPLIPRELPTWYVHNAYLYFWFKTGLIGLVLLLLFYGAAIQNVICNFRSSIGRPEAAFPAGALAVLCSFLVVSITSPQFIQKDSLLIMALCIGLNEAMVSGNLNNPDT